MSQAPNAAASDQETFTCSALCLYLSGLSRKKPPTTEPDPPAEKQPPYVPIRSAPFEKIECSSLSSGNNIVFDFLENTEKEEARFLGDTEKEEPERGSYVVHGYYCPSPCFDLPVELIRAGEGCGAVANTPVKAAFVFTGHERGALKKMASCLASSIAGKGSEARPRHLVRFLSGSVPHVPRSAVQPSCATPKAKPFAGIASSPVVRKPQVVHDGRERDRCFELHVWRHI